MSNTYGNPEYCDCEKCGHRHQIGWREIALFRGMARALWRVFIWCKEQKRTEFATREIGHILDNKTYNRFADWKYWRDFGGMVYVPLNPKTQKEYKKGHIALDMEKCAKFFRNEIMIPTQIWKHPLTGEIRAGDELKIFSQIPLLYTMLNQDHEYMAWYEEDRPQARLPL